MILRLYLVYHNNMGTKRAYTTAQVAKILGVHKNTVFYWLKTGKAKEPKRDPVFNGRLWTVQDLRKLQNVVK